MEGMSGKMTNPLEKGRGHGIIGTGEFIEKVRRKYLGSGTSPRELPAVRQILARVEPERIMGAICETFRAKREELLTKGYKGTGRGVLMEMLYRYGGMNQREIGELMGIDYSAVSVMRKRLSAQLERDRTLLEVITKVRERLQSSQE